MYIQENVKRILEEKTSYNFKIEIPKDKLVKVLSQHIQRNHSTSKEAMKFLREIEKNTGIFHELQKD